MASDQKQDEVLKKLDEIHARLDVLENDMIEVIRLNNLRLPIATKADIKRALNESETGKPL